MALDNIYTSGTVSVENGSTTVTGSGLFWGDDAIMPGDLFCDPAQPLIPPQRVKEVTADNELELWAPWPGTSMEDAEYEIRFVGIIERSTAQTRRVLEQLGDVKAWADIFVEDDAARLALETEGNPLRGGVRVLVVDTGVIWQKASGIYGDWIGPVEFKGDKGDKGWAPQLAGEADGARRVLKLIGYTGGDGSPPTTNVGKYLKADGTFTDLIGEAMDVRGPAGNIDGVTAFWQSRITADTTAAAARSGLGALGVGDFGLGSTSQSITSSGSWNDLTTTGFYYVSGGVADGPGGVCNAVVIGQSAGGGRTTQIAFRVNGDAVLRRQKFNGVWSEWVELGGSGVNEDALMFDQRIQGIHLAKLTGEAIFLGPDGSALHDAFGDLDYVDVAGATNLDTSTPGELRPDSSPGTMIPAATGTPIGNMVDGAGGGLSAAFDGIVGGNENSAGLSGSHDLRDAWIGKTFSSGRTVARIIAFARNDGGAFTNTTTPNVTLSLYGKNGTPPSTYTDGIQLGTVGPMSQSTGMQVEIVSSDQATAFDHVWVHVHHDGNIQAMWVSELEIYEPGTFSNLTVPSEAVTAALVPEWVRAAMRVRDPEGVILNTDIFVDLSRDGGSSWTTAEVVERYTQPGDVRVLDTGMVDVTSQSSGSGICWRLRTENGANIACVGAALWAGVE